MDEIFEEERFQKRLAFLSGLDEKAKRKHAREIDRREDDFYVRHTQMNGFLIKSRNRAIEEARAEAEE